MELWAFIFSFCLGCGACPSSYDDFVCYTQEKQQLPSLHSLPGRWYNCIFSTLVSTEKEKKNTSWNLKQHSHREWTPCTLPRWNVIISKTSASWRNYCKWDIPKITPNSSTSTKYSSFSFRCTQKLCQTVLSRRVSWWLVACRYFFFFTLNMSLRTPD